MLALFFSPRGKIVALVAALATWTIYQRHDAAGTERARLTLQYERATAAEVARQTAASSAAAAAAKVRAQKAEAEVKELQEKADEIKNGLSSGTDVCPIPDALRGKLRAIR